MSDICPYNQGSCRKHRDELRECSWCEKRKRNKVSVPKMQKGNQTSLIRGCMGVQYLWKLALASVGGKGTQ